MSLALPTAGQAVTLLDGDGREHRSQVSGLNSAGQLTMPRPPALTGSAVLIGTELTVTWPIGNGLVGQVAARLAAVRRSGDDQFWDIEALGEPIEVQRRASPRVQVSAPVTVSQLLDLAAPRTSDGVLVDVSELALRCSLAATEIWATRRGTQLRVSFQLDGVDFNLAGRVINSALVADRREVVVRFDQPVETGPQLRAFIDQATAGGR